LVKAAFEKVVATGMSTHRAEHVLGAILADWFVEAPKDRGRPNTVYERKIQKIIRDPVFRRKLTRKFTTDHLGLA
jgi:hypothetical protein